MYYCYYQLLVICNEDVEKLHPPDSRTFQVPSKQGRISTEQLSEQKALNTTSGLGRYVSARRESIGVLGSAPAELREERSRRSQRKWPTARPPGKCSATGEEEEKEEEEESLSHEWNKKGRR